MSDLEVIGPVEADKVTDAVDACGFTQRCVDYQKAVYDEAVKDLSPEDKIVYDKWAFDSIGNHAAWAKIEKENKAAVDAILWTICRGG